MKNVWGISYINRYHYIHYTTTTIQMPDQNHHIINWLELSELKRTESLFYLWNYVHKSLKKMSVMSISLHVLHKTGIYWRFYKNKFVGLNLELDILKLNISIFWRHINHVNNSVVFNQGRTNVSAPLSINALVRFQ